MVGKEHHHSIFYEMGFSIDEDRQPEAVLYSLGRTYNLLSRELAAVYQPFGLSTPSFNLLMLLEHGSNPGSFTQQEISKRLVVSPSDMTGLIDRLEKKGLVRRIPGKDRRSRLLRITKQGSQLLNQVWPYHMAAVERLTNMLTFQEAKVLILALAKMREVKR